jgi:hypothetical protein
MRRNRPSWQKCNNLSRLLHFCEGNKGCAFINDRKLIAGDAGRMVHFLRMEKRKRLLSGASRTERCRTFPTSWRFMQGSGINRSLFRTRSPRRGDRYCSPPRVFPVRPACRPTVRTRRSCRALAVRNDGRIPGPHSRLARPALAEYQNVGSLD